MLRFPFALLASLSLLALGCGDDTSGGSDGTETSTGSSSTSGDGSTTNPDPSSSTSDGTTTSGADSSTTSADSTTSDATSSSTGDEAESSSSSSGGAAIEIDAITPEQGIVSTAATISGFGFGDVEGTVTVDGVAAAVTSWSDTAIDITIPDVFPGPRDVVVNTDDAATDTIGFEVVLPRTVYVHHDDGSSDTNAVTAFAMDAAGALAEVAGSPFATDSGSGGFGGDSSSVLLYRPTRKLFVAGATAIAVFDVDPVDGTLAAVAGSPFPTDGTRAFGMTISADGTHLYAANCESNDITGFDVVPETGAMTLMANSPFAAPSASCVDTPHMMQADTVLAVTDEGGRMHVYTVAADGSLTVTGQSPITTSADAFLSRADPSGSRIYIADTNDLGNRIDAWELDAAGAATQITGAPFADAQLNGPHTLRFASEGQRLYVGSWDGSEISMFDVDADSALSASGVAAYDLMTGNHSGLRFTGDEQFLLALTEGQQLHVLSVAADGSLTNTAGSPYTVFPSSSSLAIAD